jgi:DNA-binding MarR family transcriptional regulator
MSEVQMPDEWPGTQLADRVQEVLDAAELARRAIARRMHLNASEVEAMQHLMGQTLGPAELSRRLGMTTASGTALVDRLEAAGHVARRPDPGDRRRKVVAPTPQGIESVLTEIVPLVTGLAGAEHGMSAKDKEVVSAYLTRIAESLRVTATAE